MNPLHNSREGRPESQQQIIYNMHNKNQQLITRDRKQIKATSITAEHYLWDQLDRIAKTDPLKDFLKTCESHLQHNKQLK